MKRFVLVLLVVLPFAAANSQNKKNEKKDEFEKHLTFESTDEYLNLLEKKYKIGREEVHYIPKAQTDSIPIPYRKKIGDLKWSSSDFVFVKNKHIVSFEELTDALCSTDRLLVGLDLDKIDRKLSKSPEYGNFIFKNMATGEIVVPEKDEVVAVFYYTYLGGKWMGRMKDRKLIAERLGIRTFVVSYDGHDLKAIEDIDKEKINMIREFSIF